MATVGMGLSMSLDGYIAGPNDGAEHPLGEGGMALFEWYETGDVPYTTPDGNIEFHISPESAAMIEETFASVGAVVTGRRTFDITNGWGGQHTLDVPVFVVTHEVPDGWVTEHPDAPFTFVTDGIERAVEQAKAVAGDKMVAVAAASLTQQCLNAGLLDLIHVDLVPVLLGGGVRLFDQLEIGPTRLERTEAIVAPDVTHLTFRVVRE